MSIAGLKTGHYKSRCSFSAADGGWQLWGSKRCRA